MRCVCVCVCVCVCTWDRKWNWDEKVFPSKFLRTWITMTHIEQEDTSWQISDKSMEHSGCTDRTCDLPRSLMSRGKPRKTTIYFLFIMYLLPFPLRINQIEAPKQCCSLPADIAASPAQFTAHTPCTATRWWEMLPEDSRSSLQPNNRNVEREACSNRKRLSLFLVCFRFALHFTHAVTAKIVSKDTKINIWDRIIFLWTAANRCWW